MDLREEYDTIEEQSHAFLNDADKAIKHYENNKTEKWEAFLEKWDLEENGIIAKSLKKESPYEQRS